MDKYTKHKKSWRNSSFPTFIVFCFIIISIVSTSIAFSAINSVLNISGVAKVMLKADIRLTGNIIYGVTNGGFENYDGKYSKEDLITSVTLPNLNSTVTYEVNVTNFVDINMILDEIIDVNFSNDSMEYFITGLTLGNYVSGMSNNVFQITFKYKDTVTELPENITLDSRIQFKFIEELKPSFGLTYLWDTGDISSRTTYIAETFDKDHNGTPYILASIQHGVRAYTPEGTIVWSYSGITYGHDTRDISVGDLQETGYNDTIVVCSGYDANTNSHHVGIVDRDGNELAEIRLANSARCYRSIIVGTDVFIGSNYGVTKLVKSGNTWVEDTENWSKPIGEVSDMYWGDLGNGSRLIVSTKSGTIDMFSFEQDGTQEWSALTAGGYDGRIEVGKPDNTKDGKQIVKAYQSGSKVFDKDGNTLATLTTGTNVRTGLTLYDNDNDGEDEIYLSDMGQDIYVWDRIGENKYTVQYSILNISSTSTDYFGLQSYDIDEDGEKEIIVGSGLGNVYIFNKDLSEKKLELNIGHGYIGSNDGRLSIRSGIKIIDINGDGHPDMLIPGGNGYVDVYINDY